MSSQTAIAELRLQEQARLAGAEASAAYSQVVEIRSEPEASFTALRAELVGASTVGLRSEQFSRLEAETVWRDLHTAHTQLQSETEALRQDTVHIQQDLYGRITHAENAVESSLTAVTNQTDVLQNVVADILMQIF